MKKNAPHTFHIPVMGLGFTIDTPIKVGRFGISSTVSIIEDNLIEQMREFYCRKFSLEYEAITKKEFDYRAKRIRAYLNLLNEILQMQMIELAAQPFGTGSDLDKYFGMLEENSFLKLLYNTMLQSQDPQEKKTLEAELKKRLLPGAIDVNIMTKCDRSYSKGDEPDIYSDALSALRGFALSDLRSSIVFSAGLNPRLYSYCESFDDFYPAANGEQKKKIIIKVNDYRSAMIQGKFLAKKGLWVSEFRVESGLNCGGHAFPTEGLLLGPILEEFKTKRDALQAELFDICNNALKAKGKQPYALPPELSVSAQGGIGTAAENKFLRDYYRLDATGWGSPFLLVPEATSVDDETLQALAGASPSDYFLSYSSPLGILFNNFRNSSSEKQRLKRIEKNRPGSPCLKKFLAFNTEFTSEPICTASREYQQLKLNQLKSQQLPEEELKEKTELVMQKDCLCEGLAVSAVIKNDILRPKQLKAVAICPGPNLAYFSGVHTLRSMVDHIYGRKNLLNNVPRPSVIINELKMYCEYLEKQVVKKEKSPSEEKYIVTFRNNLLSGIGYYKNLFAKFREEFSESFSLLKMLEDHLALLLPQQVPA